ncbi:MAG: O-acetylhomoserine aminocarboxypropyltransferase/cysteine synthase family protein [Bdellovibrionota bacterium]|jgi:O-acetylhomoserine (thiol)-lyase
MIKDKRGLSTIALHAGENRRSDTNAAAVPIYQTSSFIFDSTQCAADLFAYKKSGNIYSRLSNPTNDVLEKRIAAFEGGSAAVSTASGMAAISNALLTITTSGDEIVSTDNLYGGSYSLLNHTFRDFGRTVRFAPSTDLNALKSLITEKTKAIYTETIGNPKVDVADFEKLAEIAHQVGIPLVVDNTVGVGLVRPFDFGADIIVISATKYIGGHGTSLGGLIVDSGKFNWNNGKFPTITAPDPANHGLVFWDAFNDVPEVGNMAFAAKVRGVLLRDLGAALSPFNAFQILQGFETLPLRQKRHSENALAVAEHLEAHPKVAWVTYPGLPSSPYHAVASKYLKNGYGGLLGFGIKGGREAGVRFIDSVKLLLHLANIGDAKSLVIHPASTTHQQLSQAEQLATGVTEDYIRLSVGLEDVSDIIADIDQALEF